MANRLDPQAEEALRCFSSRTAYQEQLIDRYDRNRKAYMGVIERQSKALDYEYNGGITTNPPYLNQIVEGVVANLVDDRVFCMVNPSPRMTSPDEITRLIEGAKAHEILLAHQANRTCLTEKQREWILQAELVGFSPAKVFWRQQKGTRKTRVWVPYTDMYGEHQQDETGYLWSVQEQEKDTMVVDDPEFEVCDARDFMWQEGAVSIDNSWVIHRVYMSLEQLRQLERVGVYRNVSELEVVGSERTFDTTGPDEFHKLEQELWNEQRAKGRIEVLEYWSPDGSATVTVGNRRVLLASGPNPYWHKRKPFVILSTAPDLKRIGGVTVVDKVAPIQELLWRFQSQRLTAVELANNPIIFHDPSVNPDDIGDLEPGKLIPLPKEMVQWFVPDPASGQISLASEELLKREFQDVTGGAPWASGQQASGPAGATATEVSIITTIAQKLIAHRKQFVSWALEHVYQMMLELNQQFVTTDRLVATVGPDGIPGFSQVYADSLAGVYHVKLRAASESMMRQERRAEAQAKLLAVAQAAQIVAVLAQGKAQAGLPAKTVNLEEYVNDVLRAYDVDDVERYWSELTPPPQLMSPPGGGQEGPGDSNGNGVTNPGLAAGPSSPSNQLSGNPAMMMQRLLAARGGTSNV